MDLLLLDIYICDLFFETKNLDITSYSDDNTRFTCPSELNEVFSKQCRYKPQTLTSLTYPKTGF